MESVICHGGKNSKAITDRGWNPLNYALLTDKQIQATMTELESKAFALMMKSVATCNNLSIQEQTFFHGSTTNTTTEQSVL